MDGETIVVEGPVVVMCDGHPLLDKCNMIFVEYDLCDTSVCVFVVALLSWAPTDDVEGYDRCL